MFALLFLFVIASLLGFELINKVPPTLHTPLMSGCNAISGVTVVGAIMSVSAGQNWLGMIFGCLAIALATLNVVGGFLVTDRMLAMFKKKGT
jgi:NAD(P) transhydrogenase subunit alpha